MKFFDNLKFNLLLNFLRRAVAMREATRLLRGKYYGWFREILLHSFKILKKDYPAHFSQFTTQDFFSLTLDDIEKYSTHKVNEAELTDLIQKKKDWSEKKVLDFPEVYYHPRDKNFDDLIPYFCTSGPSYASNTKDNLSFSGLGASSGKVEGRVLILDNPRDAFKIDNLEDYILVTKNTDPAWVFIMSQCKGLISERGSLLSHTAIIGRELGIPTIVGVKEITKALRNIDFIHLDADRGIITVIEKE